MTKMKKIVMLICVLGFGFTSCNKNRFKIYSKDKRCCISIITDKPNKIRYIIADDSFDISKGNYVKISIDNIDPIAEEIIGYWTDNGCSWVLFNHNSQIIENKLDTINFKFNSQLPTKEYDIPTLDPILKKDYFRVDLSYFEIISSSGNTLVE